MKVLAINLKTSFKLGYIILNEQFERELNKLDSSFNYFNFDELNYSKKWQLTKEAEETIKEGEREEQEENFLRQLKFISSIPVNNIKSLFITNSVVTVAIYIIMIEGLGKGVKYSLFVANAIIFIGGVIVFSIGVWTLNDRSFMERLLGTNLYVAAAAILIVTGSIVSIISFLGTFGAYKEIKCMLLTYFVILVILFIVMVTAGILGYVFRLEVDDRMQQEMHSTIKLYGNDTQVTQAWDAVQTHFECCGITVRPSRGYELWRKENARFRSESGPLVPESCCRSREDDPIRRACQGKQPRREDTFYEGCYERMKEFVKSHALLVGGMAIGVSCMIIFGMVLSCALYMMIK